MYIWKKVILVLPVIWFGHCNKRVLLHVIHNVMTSPKIDMLVAEWSICLWEGQGCSFQHVWGVFVMNYDVYDDVMYYSVDVPSQRWWHATIMICITVIRYYLTTIISLHSCFASFLWIHLKILVLVTIVWNELPIWSTRLIMQS